MTNIFPKLASFRPYMGRSLSRSGMIKRKAGYMSGPTSFRQRCIKRSMTFRLASCAENCGPLRVRGLCCRSTMASKREHTRSRNLSDGFVFLGRFGYSASKRSALESRAEWRLLSSSSSTSDMAPTFSWTFPGCHLRIGEIPDRRTADSGFAGREWDFRIRKPFRKAFHIDFEGLL